MTIRLRAPLRPAVSLLWGFMIGPALLQFMPAPRMSGCQRSADPLKPFPDGGRVCAARCAGDLGTFAAVYRFCADTVQPPLPGFGAVLADYARWLPGACQADAAALIAGAAA